MRRTRRTCRAAGRVWARRKSEGWAGARSGEAVEALRSAKPAPCLPRGPGDPERSLTWPQHPGAAPALARWGSPGPAPDVAPAGPASPSRVEDRDGQVWGTVRAKARVPRHCAPRAPGPVLDREGTGARRAVPGRWPSPATRRGAAAVLRPRPGWEGVQWSPISTGRAVPRADWPGPPPPTSLLFLSYPAAHRTPTCGLFSLEAPRVHGGHLTASHRGPWPFLMSLLL